MFDPAAHDDLLAAAQRVASAPVALATEQQKTDALRTLGRVRDVLDGALAVGMDDLSTTEAYAAEAAPTAVAWARQHLRLDVRAARRLVAAGRTLRMLPAVAAAAQRGDVRLEHVGVLTSAITRLGAPTVVEAESWLLDVARSCEPTELKGVLDALADALEPDALERAYAAGMDRADLQIAATTGGYHLTGFLDLGAGSRFTTWLEAASAPRDADDERTPAQRRVDALDDLVTSALEHGLPTDRGIRPQVHVTVDLETLSGDPLAPPARLATGGLVPMSFLRQMLCDSTARAVVVAGQSTGPTPQAHVLDVGRTRRLATPAQRIAVLHRQEWRCATPGCGARHLQIHHVDWWDRDHGPTDLDNLIGLCTRCHTLVHTEHLTITRDGHGGWILTRTTGHVVPDHHRRTHHTIRQRLRALRVALRQTGPPGTAHAPPDAA